MIIRLACICALACVALPRQLDEPARSRAEGSPSKPKSGETVYIAPAIEPPIFEVVTRPFR